MNYAIQASEMSKWPWKKSARNGIKELMMPEYKPWPHVVDFDDDIRAAIPPGGYVRYDVTITNRYDCELFIHLNGEPWRKCAELILEKLMRCHENH